jgi:N-acetylglucosamine-6-phosphate deacetylase
MATLTPARIAGRDSDIGSIAPGKWADLLILDANLNVRQVFLAGKPAYDVGDRETANGRSIEDQPSHG